MQAPRRHPPRMVRVARHSPRVTGQGRGHRCIHTARVMPGKTHLRHSWGSQSPPPWREEGPMVFAAEFGTGQVVWTLVWMTLLVILVWLLIAVFKDLVRSSDLSGWGKAAWALFVLVVPFIGVLVYVMVRADQMNAHSENAARARDDMVRAYVREPSSPDQDALSSPAAS